MQAATPRPAQISEILLICSGLIIALMLLADALAGSAPTVSSAAALPAPALHISLHVAPIVAPSRPAASVVANSGHPAPAAHRAPAPLPAATRFVLPIGTPVAQLPRPHIITARSGHLAIAPVTPTRTITVTVVAKVQGGTAVVPAATPTRLPISAAATKPVRAASPTPRQPRATATPAAAQPTPTVGVPQPTVVTAPARPPADDETRTAIVAMLARRQQAAMSGDGDSFIDTVDPADDILRNEQTTWFAALRDSPPSYYALELGSLSVNPRRDRAVGLLTERAKLDSGDIQAVKAEVVFVKRGDSWYYADLDFQTLANAHFRIRFFASNRAIGNALYKAADRTYAQITADLGTTPEGVSEVKLYPSTTLLQNSVMLSLPAWVGGWSMPGQSIKTAYNGVATSAYVNLMAHEFTHQCEASLGLNRANSPDWLNEGLAVYEAEHIAPFSYEVNTRPTLLRKALASNSLFDWNDYPSFAQVTGGQVSLAYAQAYSAVQYLIEKYGRAQFNQMLANLVAGSSPDEAFTLAFNTSLADFDTAWRAWLAAKLKW